MCWGIGVYDGEACVVAVIVAVTVAVCVWVNVVVGMGPTPNMVKVQACG